MDGTGGRGCPGCRLRSLRGVRPRGPRPFRRPETLLPPEWPDPKNPARPPPGFVPSGNRNMPDELIHPVSHERIHPHLRPGPNHDPHWEHFQPGGPGGFRDRVYPGGRREPKRHPSCFPTGMQPGEVRPGAPIVERGPTVEGGPPTPGGGANGLFFLAITLLIFAISRTHRSADRVMASSEEARMGMPDRNETEAYYSHPDYDHLRCHVLHLRTWRPSQPAWDHDHCEVCGRVISDGEYEHALAAAYANAAEDFWICPDCFGKYRQFFDLEPRS